MGSKWVRFLSISEKTLDIGEMTVHSFLKFMMTFTYINIVTHESFYLIDHALFLSFPPLNICFVNFIGMRTVTLCIHYVTGEDSSPSFCGEGFVIYLCMYIIIFMHVIENIFHNTIFLCILWIWFFLLGQKWIFHLKNKCYKDINIYFIEAWMAVIFLVVIYLKRK